MLLDTLKLRSTVFQVQYPAAFEMWDNAGATSRQLAGIWPGLKVNTAEPFRITLQSEDVHHPSALPQYALHELLAGLVRYLCDAHNILLSAENIGEALLALGRNPFQGRKGATKQEALAEVLSQVLSNDPSAPRSTVSDDALDALALKTAGLWSRAKAHKRLDYVQALGCFDDGDLTFGEANELRGPNDSFNCLAKERCAAAAYMHEDKATLEREYRESCMKARGYTLDWELAGKDGASNIHGVGPEALWRWEAKYWKPAAK